MKRKGNIMASRTPLDKKIQSVLKYDVSRPYIGNFKFSDLYSAQADLRQDAYHLGECGVRSTCVYIGKINGDVICGALWRLMEYNPGRFVDNPFVYNGRYNIFRFASDTAFPMDPTTANVISGVRGKLRDYLLANSAPNGQWRDEIETDNGFVDTILNNGRTGPMYKKLCLLRDAVKVIAKQNCADFSAKSKPYRNSIIAAVRRMHPDIFVQKTQSAPVMTPTQMDDDDTDKIYDRMDALQITLDNRAGVSPELYDQARADMARLQNMLQSIQHNNTL